MSRTSAALLARLWPLLSAAASVTACAGKPVTDVAAAPAGTGSAAPPATTPPQTTAVPTVSAKASTGEPRSAGPSNTAAAAPSAPSPGGALPRCRACDLHCYAHAAGEKCLPGETGAALDARVGCLVTDRAGPSDDGKQCCYGQPCVGRPLLRDRAPVIAPLLAGTAHTGWA